jgi:hypothetical protein
MIIKLRQWYKRESHALRQWWLKQRVLPIAVGVAIGIALFDSLLWRVL